MLTIYFYLAELKLFNYLCLSLIIKHITMTKEKVLELITKFSTPFLIQMQDAAKAAGNMKTYEAITAELNKRNNK